PKPNPGCLQRNAPNTAAAGSTAGTARRLLLLAVRSSKSAGRAADRGAASRAGAIGQARARVRVRAVPVDLAGRTWGSLWERSIPDKQHYRKYSKDIRFLFETIVAKRIEDGVA